MQSLLARVIAFVLVGVLCVTGPVMLLFAAGTGLERLLFLRSSLSTDGIVVAQNYTYSQSKPMSHTCSPIFRFTTENGMSVTVTSHISQSQCPWQIGQPVRVLYQQDHPENAHIDSLVQLWGLQIILGAIGAALSIFSLLIVLRRSSSTTIRIQD